MKINQTQNHTWSVSNVVMYCDTRADVHPIGFQPLHVLIDKFLVRVMSFVGVTYTAKFVRDRAEGMVCKD